MAGSGSASAVLEQAAFKVLERPGPEVSRETDGSPHVCWGMHLFDERMGTLTRHPAVVDEGASMTRPQKPRANRASSRYTASLNCSSQSEPGARRRSGRAGELDQHADVE